MTSKAFIRALAPVLAATLLSLGAGGMAQARNLSYSVGGGVKCYYVLVSSSGGTNVWQTVCRKSGV